MLFLPSVFLEAFGLKLCAALLCARRRLLSSALLPCAVQSPALDVPAVQQSRVAVSSLPISGSWEMTSVSPLTHQVCWAQSSSLRRRQRGRALQSGAEQGSGITVRHAAPCAGSSSDGGSSGYLGNLFQALQVQKILND